MNHYSRIASHKLWKARDELMPRVTNNKLWVTNLVWLLVDTKWHESSESHTTQLNGEIIKLTISCHESRITNASHEPRTMICRVHRDTKHAASLLVSRCSRLYCSDDDRMTRVINHEHVSRSTRSPFVSWCRTTYTLGCTAAMFLRQWFLGWLSAFWNWEWNIRSRDSLRSSRTYVEEASHPLVPSVRGMDPEVQIRRGMESLWTWWRTYN